jgi:hypothetical protein
MTRAATPTCYLPTIHSQSAENTFYRYDESSNANLLATYGFVLQGNPHDLILVLPEHLRRLSILSERGGRERDSLSLPASSGEKEGGRQKARPQKEGEGPSSWAGSRTYQMGRGQKPAQGRIDSQGKVSEEVQVRTSVKRDPIECQKRPNTFCTTTRLNFFESAALLGELRVRVRLALERLEEEEEEEEEEETGMR